MTGKREAHRSRPQMKNYGIQTADAGMMNWADVEPNLEKSRNYWIGSTQPDGKPHAAPVWGIWLEGALYFSSGRSSRKARNLLNNPQVVVHLESGDDAVILEGKVAELTDKTLYARIRELYGKKYPFIPTKEMNPGDVWFVLKPDVALAWLETDFTRSATRWTFTD